MATRERAAFAADALEIVARDPGRLDCVSALLHMADGVPECLLRAIEKGDNFRVTGKSRFHAPIVC